ncbi:MAG: polyketide synthase dehydratase domain-containing protein [Deltaproteobacteria bacterium]|nr:polyketide synthase dehydratase domain-containing protein [Deltaproteobacteria bacterium]
MSHPRRRPETLPIALPPRPAWRDHVVRGRAVLPAVEALQTLARAALQRDPVAPVRRSTDARFTRFLDLPPDDAPIDALLELDPGADRSVTATLSTRRAAGSSGVVRACDHVRVVFGAAAEPTPPRLEDALLPGPLFALDPQRLYAELVPFGPAFRNARAPILLGRAGAVARLGAPADDAADTLPLGSPYPLDAAMHVACAWAQRYQGRVLFPSAYGARHVLEPIPPGRETLCRIIPLATDADGALFDLWLRAEDGTPHEVVRALRLSDLFHGEISVPPWVRAAEPDVDSLAPLRQACAGLVLLELDALPPFAGRLLTPRERTRLSDLGPDRGRSFVAARAALKLLARELYPKAAAAPAETIETVWPDGTHPTVELAGLPDGLHSFAAAHDERFAVAVAGDRPLGVDCEPLTGRALRGARMFASEEERRRIGDCGLDPQEAALLVWTTKEAAAKAMDVPLAAAWRGVAVTRVGARSSDVLLDGRPSTAHHARVDDHLFTLLSMPE